MWVIYLVRHIYDNLNGKGIGSLKERKEFIRHFRNLHRYGERVFLFQPNNQILWQPTVFMTVWGCCNIFDTENYYDHVTNKGYSDHFLLRFQGAIWNGRTVSKMNDRCQRPESCLRCSVVCSRHNKETFRYGPNTSVQALSWLEAKWSGPPKRQWGEIAITWTISRMVPSLASGLYNFVTQFLQYEETSADFRLHMNKWCTFQVGVP